MTKYIKLSDNSYPHTEAEIRAAHPNTSFPTPFIPDGYAVVFPVPQPAYNSVLQIVREIAPVYSVAKGFWEQTWEVAAKYATQPEIDAAVTENCMTCCANRCKEVDALWSSKLWTNYTATFPDGPKVIQFRDSGDQSTAQAVYSDAVGKIIAGAPLAECKFYTEDNNWQYTTAEEMRVIFKGLFDAKQALKVKATEHKSVLRALMNLGDTAGILAYNIQAGW